MTPPAGGPLRVALLDHAAGADSRVLAAALQAAGHGPEAIGSHAIDAAEALLRLRGFTPQVSHVPGALRALARGGFDVAHAFTVPDAIAALAWRRRSGRPVVYTCGEPIDRAVLADRRLRLWSLRRAVEGADALLVPGEEARAAFERWLVARPVVASARDAAVHERLYRDLIARRAG